MLTAAQAVAKVAVLYAGLAARRPEITRMEAYFRGDHPLTYATPEWAKAHQDRYKGFSDNWCRVVGTAPGQRTEVVGFRLPSEASYEPLSEAERLLWDDWDRNDMPAQASQGFLTSTIAKRSAVLVWADSAEEPVMTWEHPSQVIVDYDPEVPRIRRAALKAWLEDDLEYATLYTPDHVWKFQRPRGVGITAGMTVSGLHVSSLFTGGDWTPRADTGDDVWPIPNPMGVVPIVEYQNRPMLGGEPLSDIEGTIAMQDAINILWAYTFVAADYASMPARVVMGQDPPKIPVLDANGQKIGEKAVDIAELTKGRMLWLTGQTAKVGQWDAARLDVFTDVINVAVRHVAAQTSTPIYLVHGELGNVNGETLTGLDAPLVTKIQEGHKFYRSPTQEVFRLAALVRGDDAVARACRTGTVSWRDPQMRNDAQVSDAALKDRQVGWPLQAVLERRYGLPPDEVARYLAMAEAEQSDPLAAGLLRGLSGDAAGV